ncbi:acyltransferase, partial [Gardnerella swidsinskii]
MVVEQKQSAQKVASSAQAQAVLQSSKDLQNGTQKDLQVEVLRIIAMLMIVACHMIIHLNIREHSFNMELLPAPGLRSALKFLVVQYGQVGVSTFFIISGYFLCRKTFRYRRVFAAWAQ